MSKNVECGLISTEDDCDPCAGGEFACLWNHARSLTADLLNNYAAEFADRNRKRTPLEMEELGIGDTEESSRPFNQRAHRPPDDNAIETRVAAAAWAGLQSFTGEFKFQVEFPRAAGEVIHRILGEKEEAEGRVSVFCVDDSRTVEMQYRFYADNSMFRLNVPNDAAGVAWSARKQRWNCEWWRRDRRVALPCDSQSSSPVLQLRRL